MFLARSASRGSLLPMRPSMARLGRFWDLFWLTGQRATNLLLRAVRHEIRPTMALAKILARLSNDDGSINLPGIYDKVRPLTEDEKKSIAALPSNDELFRKQEHRTRY